MKNRAAGLLCAGFCYLLQWPAIAAGHYDSGASATEIRIGNIAPYTGPAQAYAVVARAEAAYFRMINDRGGINGRRIEFISADDASDPAQALPLARRLVETDQVLALFSTFGTDANLAIRGYANERKIFAGRPIGSYQGIQFPLAEAHIQCECARLMNYKAASLHDEGKPYGSEANMGKWLAGHAAGLATDRAIQTMGGMGYSKEYHVERLWRDARLFRIAPISEEMVLNFVAQHDLGMPRSY